MEKHRDGQRELHCAFAALEKANEWVPREELWLCLKGAGVAEKYVRTGAGYVREQYDSGGVRCRSDRWLQAGGRTTSTSMP